MCDACAMVMSCNWLWSHVELALGFFEEPTQAIMRAAVLDFRHPLLPC